MLNEGVAALVFDCGSGLFWAGYDASYAEFPFVVGRTGMLSILVGMDQKDRYAVRCFHTVVHTPVVCNDRCHGSWGAENCGISAVAVHPGRRHPGRGAEADSHGLACSEDQKDSAAQYFSWWSMPLLCRSFLLCPLLLRQARMVQTLQKFVEVPQSQFLSCCGRRCHDAATSCLATVKVPLIRFIARVSGHFFS